MPLDENAAVASTKVSGIFKRIMFVYLRRTFYNYFYTNAV